MGNAYELPGFAEAVDVAEMVAAACFFVGGLLLGWLVQRVAIGKLRQRGAVTTWGGERILVEALHGTVVVWFALAGIFAAISVLPLMPRLGEGLGRLLTVVLIGSVTIATARIVTNTIRYFARQTDQTMRSSSIFVNLSRILIGVLGLLIVLQTLGVSITPMLTALGIGGLAVALALQDTLSNFFAGLQIVATKKVKPGDFVRVETGEEGYVVDIDWRHTSIRQLPSNMVLVPNSKLVSSIIVNYHYPEPEMSVLVQVGVSYDSDLEQVERVTVEVGREVLREVEGGVADFEPFIRYHTFGDSSIDFSVILRVKEFTDQYPLMHEFVKRLHRRYREEGIVIPFPIRTIDWPQSQEETSGEAVDTGG